MKTNSESFTQQQHTHEPLWHEIQDHPDDRPLPQFLISINVSESGLIAPKALDSLSRHINAKEDPKCK
jgi:hypothetical protein